MTPVNQLAVWRCVLLLLASLALQARCPLAEADEPPFTDYCSRMQQDIQGRKHGFLAGNLTYYVGGFHASWNLIEHETLGLTHPFHHDLRSRGVGLKASSGEGADNTGVGNDFSGWEFYKDTRVLYGSVVIGDSVIRHPVPSQMYWRPDRMICEYEVSGVTLREEKFIAENDAACSLITSSKPVLLRFGGNSFFGRHSVKSTATIKYDDAANSICIVEGGTTRCKPDTDRQEQIAPIMYQGMSTVLTASRDFSDSHRFEEGEHGEQKYEFEVPCDSKGVALVWAMDDNAKTAQAKASSILGDGADAIQQAKSQRDNKTQAVNRLLNEQIPFFRCSDRQLEDIYYFLWSLYLMYEIDVQRGMEMEPHTQTAVNNFLGMHRYDATFQSRVGAWTNDKTQHAYGNILTWKHLFENGHYQQSPNGVIALSDNKGTTWHSGVYGNELSEHVLAAWQIYQQSGDVEFLRDCYEGYFQDVFADGIAPFFSNHFEVTAALIEMAKLTGHPEDVPGWNRLVSLKKPSVKAWFRQRWQANGHENFFGGPADGMLMTTGFWHMRSKHFPRKYASKMVDSWALDRTSGFLPERGRPFPLAMSEASMRKFKSQADQAFGYTPDTAYFTLDAMFRRRLKEPAARLTLDHLRHYNFHPEWKIPVAPEAYKRDGTLFGDQYSNFNAGKLLLILEGLAGLKYSIPNGTLTVQDALPQEIKWMEIRLPIRMPGEQKTHWPRIVIQQSTHAGESTKMVRVIDSPLQLIIEPWSHERQILEGMSFPMSLDPLVLRSTRQRIKLERSKTAGSVHLKLAAPQAE